jgi:hypothetical protein
MLEAMADVDCCHDGAFELIGESFREDEQINRERNKNERARNKTNESAQIPNATGLSGTDRRVA